MNRADALKAIAQIAKSVPADEMPAWQFYAINANGSAADIMGQGCPRCMAHAVNRLTAYTLAVSEACETIPDLPDEAIALIIETANVNEPHSGSTH